MQAGVESLDWLLGRLDDELSLEFTEGPAQHIETIIAAHRESPRWPFSKRLEGIAPRH